MAARPRQGGQALVEFALIIPVFLLIFISLFDVGRAVFAYNSVTNAAREGARLAIVNQGTTAIQQRAIAQTAIAETASPNVTVAFRKTTPNADYLTNAVCTTIALDCVAIVTFETTYRPITPIVSNILFPSGVTLRATAIESVEYVCPNTVIATSAGCPKQP
jgi:Flp pilus assembly protein TadG